MVVLSSLDREILLSHVLKVTRSYLYAHPTPLLTKEEEKDFLTLLERAKKGEPIKPNVAAVLGKLNITPMKVGFIPIAAYDATSSKVYSNIKINKKAALEILRVSISKSLGFAVYLNYITDKTVSHLIRKAALQEKAMQNKINDQSNKEEAQ